MLTFEQRLNRYIAQNNGGGPTPKQSRRMVHKERHQSQEAADRRKGVAAIRLLVAQARKARLAGLTPKS